MSEIRLDFSVDDICLARMHNKWQALAGERWAYGLAFFDAPISCQIDNVVLLDEVPAPLYSVASLGLIALRELPDTGTAKVPFWGTSFELQFTFKQGTVHVYQVLDEISGSIEYDKFLVAWVAFAEKVRRFVVVEFPDAREAPDVIGEWFRTEKT